MVGCAGPVAGESVAVISWFFLLLSLYVCVCVCVCVCV
jgi:hypothetical protein